MEDTVLNKFVCPLLIFNSWYHLAALTTSVPREGIKDLFGQNQGIEEFQSLENFVLGSRYVFSAVITECFHYINVTDTKFFGKSGRFVA